MKHMSTDRISIWPKRYMPNFSTKYCQKAINRIQSIYLEQGWLESLFQTHTNLLFINCCAASTIKISNAGSKNMFPLLQRLQLSTHHLPPMFPVAPGFFIFIFFFLFFFNWIKEMWKTLFLKRRKLIINTWLQYIVNFGPLPWIQCLGLPCKNPSCATITMSRAL